MRLWAGNLRGMTGLNGSHALTVRSHGGNNQLYAEKRRNTLSTGVLALGFRYLS